jgi:acyl-CoA reductase-like NAD-dependent aldehyde dehydrogenase
LGHGYQDRLDSAPPRASQPTATRFGLSKNLWTRDLTKARRLARDLESGDVFINGTRVRGPYGALTCQVGIPTLEV